MISRRQRWFLWACAALYVSAAVCCGLLVGLPRVSDREWDRFWEEPHTLLVVLLWPPAFVLLLVILAVLARSGESGRTSTGELDVLLKLKRRGLLRPSHRERAGSVSDGLPLPVADTSGSSSVEETVLDRLVRRKRQGALSPQRTATTPARSSRFYRKQINSDFHD
jgi:hypothetical protein